MNDLLIAALVVSLFVNLCQRVKQRDRERFIQEIYESRCHARDRLNKISREYRKMKAGGPIAKGEFLYQDQIGDVIAAAHRRVLPHFVVRPPETPNCEIVSTAKELVYHDEYALTVECFRPCPKCRTKDILAPYCDACARDIQARNESEAL